MRGERFAGWRYRVCGNSGTVAADCLVGGVDRSVETHRGASLVLRSIPKLLGTPPLSCACGVRLPRRWTAPGTPKARRPALRLRIDFGAELGVLRSTAQLTANYTVDTLVGLQIAAVVNFPPRQVGKHMSECLVLGFPDERGEPVLIRPERAVSNGGRLW